MSQSKNNFLVCDLETNGIGSFRPPTQIITQLAYIKFDTDTIIKQYTAILTGASQVNKNVAAVKVTLKDIKDSGIEPLIAFNHFMEAIDENTIIVCHNTDFDIELLKRDFKAKGLVFPNNKVFCTMKNSTKFCKIPKSGSGAKYGGFKYPKLSELANTLGIPTSEDSLHDALYDCQITRNCFLKGIEKNVFKIDC